MSENKVGVEFYIAGAQNVARDVQKINSTLAGVGKAATFGGVMKAGLAFLGVRTSLRAVGREARQFYSDAISNSKAATTQIDAMNNSWAETKKLLGQGLGNAMSPLYRSTNQVLESINAMIRSVTELRGLFDKLSVSEQNAVSAAYEAQTGKPLITERKVTTPGPAMFAGPYATIAGKPVTETHRVWHQPDDQILAYNLMKPHLESDEVNGVTQAQEAARAKVVQLNEALNMQLRIQRQLNAGNKDAAQIEAMKATLDEAYPANSEKRAQQMGYYEESLRRLNKLKRDLAVGQYIQGMEQEVEYLRLVVEGREQEAEALRIVNDLKKQGIELTPAEKQQVEALVAEQAALSKEIDKQQDSARRWSRVMKQSIDGVADALAGAIVYSEDLEENFKNLALSLAFDWTSQAISSGIGAMMQAVTMHTGGVVGRDSGQPRWVDPMIFAGAPRLHGGLRSDEFPAILQRGEEVLSRDTVRAGRSSPNVSVHVVNNGTAKDARSSEPEWNGREWVIGVILDDYDKGGKTRALIRGRR